MKWSRPRNLVFRYPGSRDAGEIYSERIIDRSPNAKRPRRWVAENGVTVSRDQAPLESEEEQVNETSSELGLSSRLLTGKERIW